MNVKFEVPLLLRILWSFSRTENAWKSHTSAGLCILYGWTSEKAMAPHSNTLAWKIPWMEKPGRLQSMGSLRVGHD